MNISALSKDDVGTRGLHVDGRATGHRQEPLILLAAWGAVFILTTHGTIWPICAESAVKPQPNSYWPRQAGGVRLN